MKFSGSLCAADDGAAPPASCANAVVPITIATIIIANAFFIAIPPVLGVTFDFAYSSKHFWRTLAHNSPISEALPAPPNRKRNAPLNKP
jgi:hypothetical protein